MNQKKVPGVAVIGCGYWGRNLARNFSELGGLAAVCDVSCFLDGQTLKETGKLVTDNEAIAPERWPPQPGNIENRGERTKGNRYR